MPEPHTAAPTTPAERLATTEMPKELRLAPRDKHGYPVPWFVAFINGEPDFRVIKPGAIDTALSFRLCWICGGDLSHQRVVWFTIGPMCAVNRTSAEPPAHRACALYSAKVCPFLTVPSMRRRETGKPEDAHNPGGIMLTRNPGVTLLWGTRSFARESDGAGGHIMRIGDPEAVVWLCGGREASRVEVLTALESGLPILEEHCVNDAERTELARMADTARELVPG